MTQLDSTHSVGNPRKVVVLCQVFYPDAQSTSQLLTQLLCAMSTDRSIECTVLCGYPSANREGLGRVARVECHQGVRIERHGLQIDVKAGVLSRAVAYASYLLHVGWRLLRTDRDAVHFGVTNPPFMAILLWFVSVLRGLPYQYMLQDVYPEGLVATGKLQQRSLVTRLWMAMNGFAYRRADKLIVLGRDMAALLRRNYGIADKQIVYIPHWSASEVSDPLPFDGNPVTIERGLENKFVVQYSGNMGLWHDMDTFVRAAADLRHVDGIRFLFIGGGMRKKQAKQLADDLQATNIIWADFVPKRQLAHSLACCHVSLVSLNTGLEGIAVPCKIYGILASARPMIAMAPAKSEVGLVVAEENCGIVLPPGDQAGLVEAILALFRDRTRTLELAVNGTRAYHAKYRLKQAVAAFNRLWAREVPPAES